MSDRAHRGSSAASTSSLTHDRVGTHRQHHRRRAASGAVQREARRVIESLELRKLLATVGGTAGNDTILVDIVGANIVITVNGTPNNFTDAANTTIIVNAGDGNDTITVNGNGDNVTTINGGIGDDSVVVGDGDFDTNIASNIVVNGDAGTLDRVRVNDSTDGPGGDAVTITGTTLTKPGAAVLTFATSVEGFVLDGSPSAETINLNSTNTSTAQTINAAGGNDTIIVGNNDYDANIDGSVTVNGGGGTDSVQVDDESDAGADTYTLDGNFSKSSSLAVLNVSSDLFTISAPFGAIAHTFNINGYIGQVLVGAGDGADVFNVGDGDYDTNLSLVTIQGDGGADVLNFNDATDGAADANVYDIFDDHIQKGDVNNVLTFTNTLESIVINGSPNADLYNVNSTLAAIGVTVNAGAGNDTLDAAAAGDSHTNDVDNAIVNAFAFNGGADTDRVDLTDTGDSPDPETYSLTNTSFTKSSGTFGSLSFDGTNEAFNLIANDGNNPISYGNFPAGKQITISGGLGDDTISTSNVNAELNDTSTLILSGGSGANDTWNINEIGDVDADEYTMTSGTFQVTAGNTSGVITYGAFDAISFVGSNQPTTFRLNSLGTTPFTLDLSDGADTLRVGGGDLDTNIDQNLTVNGGLGVDSIVAEDASDGVGADTLDLVTGSLTKGVRAIAITAFEAQQYVGNVHPTVITVDSGNLPTTITGGAGSELVNVTPTGNDLDAFNSTLTVDGNGGNDTVTLNDTSDAGNDEYVVTATQVTKPGAGAFDGLIYGTIELLNVLAGVAAHTVTIDGSTANTPISINGGDGNDTFDVGGADSVVTGFGEEVTVVGAGGVDVLNFNDQGSATDNDYELALARVQRLGQSGLFFDASIEGVNVNAGTGADEIDILQLPNELYVINAGGGNDTVNLGNGTIGGALDLLGDSTVNGGAGADLFNVGAGDLDELVGLIRIAAGGNTGDAIVVNDSADAGSLATNYTIGDDTFARAGAGTAFGGLTFFDETSIRFRLNASGTPVTINDAVGGSAINGGIVEGNGGIDTFTVVNAPTAITIRGGAGLDNIEVNSDSADVASVRFDQDEDFQGITNRSGGLIRFIGDIAVRATTSTSIAGAAAGVVDIDVGTLIGPAGSVNSYTDALERGFNGGAWNGVANGSFRSNTAAASILSDALGYAVIGVGANQLNVASVHGVPVVAGDVVVTYTLAGDANLNRLVNFDDLLMMARNYAPAVGGRNWVQGNFNYNTPDTAVGAVGFEDLLLLAKNYNQSVAPAAPSPSSAASVVEAAATRKRATTSLEDDALA